MDPGIKKQEGYQNVPMDHIDCFCFLPVENTGNGKELAKNRKTADLLQMLVVICLGIAAIWALSYFR